MRAFIPLIISCAAASFSFTVSASPAAAQEASLFGVSASSNEVEFPSPVGVGAAVAWQAGSDWLFRLSYVRTYDSTVKDGTVCITYSPRIGCHTETVSTEDSFSGLRFGAMRTVQVTSFARLGVGAGLSLNAIHIDARGDNGHPADMERPLTAEGGYLGMVHVRLSPVPSVPFAITAGFQEHWVAFKSCSDPPMYAPFCGVKAFHETQVGIVYTVG